MEAILQFGIDFILAFQSLGTWLALPMQLFTFLGSENFFMLALPMLYWCVSPDLGARVGAILLFTGGVNEVFKLAFHGPRPFWYSTEVKALTAETSFGVPSGHAQIATGVWGTLAAQIKRKWAWPVAILIILLIGLSRLYLAAHFVHDVLLGWLIGAIVLWLFLSWWDVTVAWAKKQTFWKQIGVAFLFSMLLVVFGAISFLALQTWVLPQSWVDTALLAGEDFRPNPITLSGPFTSAGALFGLLAGLAWLAPRGGYSASGPLWQRIVRYILGLVGVAIFWYGLGAIFPRAETVLSYTLRYIRYALVGLWISAGAPYLFIVLKLAQKKN